MRIVSIDVMKVPSGNAGASRGEWSPVIVRVNTDEGISGFGEVGLAYGKDSVAATAWCRTSPR
ncbi:MAG: hypothetical protein R3E48_14565 [Burkholderiaceae bacterium]